MKEIIAKLDTTCTGKAYTRYTIGTMYTKISGALYLYKEEPLPEEILIRIKKEEEE